MHLFLKQSMFEYSFSSILGQFNLLGIAQNYQTVIGIVKTYTVKPKILK